VTSPRRVDPLNDLEGVRVADRDLEIQREVRNVVQSYHNVASYTAADIVAELLQNSLDAIDQYLAEHQEGAGRVDVVVDCDSNLIRVVDDGCGMPELEAERLLAPGRGTKEVRTAGTRSRGYKGVGMTFLAYGYNDLEIVTATPDGGGVRVSLAGGRAWVEATEPHDVSSRPQAEVLTGQKPQLADGSVLDHGTSVTIRFDKDDALISPRHLARAILSADMAVAVLQRQSAVGHVNLAQPDQARPYDIRLHYIRKSETATRPVAARYRYPHEVVADVVQSSEVGVAGRLGQGLRAARTSRGMWHSYTTDALVSLISATSRNEAEAQFDSAVRKEVLAKFAKGVDPGDPAYEEAYNEAGADRKAAIAQYLEQRQEEFVDELMSRGQEVRDLRITAYGFLAPRSARGEMQDAWGLGGRDSDLTKYGYRVSIGGLITPILHDVGLRGEAGYRNNMWVLYDIGTHVDLDMGRKTLPRQVSDLIARLDEQLSDDLKVRALSTGAVNLGGPGARKSPGPNPNARAQALAATWHRYEGWEGSTNALLGLHVLGPAVQESDVINHFVALTQTGYLGHLLVSQSFSRDTYDMLAVTTPERLDPRRLPERLRSNQPVEAGAVKTLEFKKRLVDLEQDLADATKVWSEMDLLVCWEIGSCETLQVEETVKATNPFSGSTHLASYGSHKLPVIAIKDFLDLSLEVRQ
jgi:hypothetical protein